MGFWAFIILFVQINPKLDLKIFKGLKGFKPNIFMGVFRSGLRPRKERSTIFFLSNLNVQVQEEDINPQERFEAKFYFSKGL